MEDQYFTGTNGYRVHRKDPNRYEHRDVWSSANGPIPTDCHIHHKNKIRSDNRIDNLECIKAADHLRMHGLTPEMLKHIRRVRRLKRRRLFKCVECSVEKETFHRSQRFCSPRCRKDYYGVILNAKKRADRSWKYTGRVCSVCSLPLLSAFQTKFCSHACVNLAGARKYHEKKIVAANGRASNVA